MCPLGLELARRRAATALRLALVQRALREPAVEVHPVARRSVARIALEHAARRPAGASSSGSRVGGARDLRGELGDVLALVAVLGRLLAARAGLDRLAERCDLAAGVVDVVLALDGVAGELEEPRERVAVGGVAAAGGGQRARSGWRRRTRRGSARRRPAQPRAAARRRRRARPPARRRTSASARKRFRKPGPATSTRSSRSPSSAPSSRAEPLGDLARRRASAPAPAASPRSSSSRRSRPSWGARASARLLGASGAAARSVGGGGLDGLAELVERVVTLSDGRARRRGSCGRGRAARAARRGRAGGAASSGRATAGGRRASSSMPVRAADHEAQVAPACRRSSSQRLKASRVDTPRPPRSSSDTKARSGIRRATCVVLAHLDQLEPRVAAQQPLVVLDVVGVRRPQPPDGQHDEAHALRY